MKVWNYVVITIVMMLVLTFLGFSIGGFSQLFTLIGLNYSPDTGQITNITTSAAPFMETIFGDGSVKGILLALLAAGGAVIIGLYAKADVENLILLPFITGTLVLFVEAFVSLMVYSISNAPTFITGAVVIIFLPLTIGFIFALAEFFRGTD